MGAWGHGIFDNDAAGDWVGGLEESSDLSVISRAIHAVFDEEYIESDTASEALAAIDTLARLKGQYGIRNEDTEEVDSWVENNPIDPPKELIDKSNKALELISSDSSELYELWAATDEIEEWKSEVESLKSRINT
jgi:Domain of unknown function (DUF4259)